MKEGTYCKSCSLLTASMTVKEDENRKVNTVNKVTILKVIWSLENYILIIWIFPKNPVEANSYFKSSSLEFHCLLQTVRWKPALHHLYQIGFKCRKLSRWRENSPLLPDEELVVVFCLFSWRLLHDYSNAVRSHLSWNMK